MQQYALHCITSQTTYGVSGPVLSGSAIIGPPDHKKAKTAYCIMYIFCPLSLLCSAIERRQYHVEC